MLTPGFSSVLKLGSEGCGGLVDAGLTEANKVVDMGISSPVEWNPACFVIFSSIIETHGCFFSGGQSGQVALKSCCKRHIFSLDFHPSCEKVTLNQNLKNKDQSGEQQIMALTLVSEAYVYRREYLGGLPTLLELLVLFHTFFIYKYMC